MIALNPPRTAPFALFLITLPPDNIRITDDGTIRATDDGGYRQTDRGVLISDSGLRHTSDSGQILSTDS